MLNCRHRRYTRAATRITVGTLYVIQPVLVRPYVVGRGRAPCTSADSAHSLNRSGRRSVFCPCLSGKLPWSSTSIHNDLWRCSNTCCRLRVWSTGHLRHSPGNGELHSRLLSVNPAILGTRKSLYRTITAAMPVGRLRRPIRASHRWSTGAFTTTTTSARASVNSLPATTEHCSGPLSEQVAINFWMISAPLVLLARFPLYSVESLGVAPVTPAHCRPSLPYSLLDAADAVGAAAVLFARPLPDPIWMLVGMRSRLFPVPASELRGADIKSWRSTSRTQSRKGNWAFEFWGFGLIVSRDRPRLATGASRRPCFTSIKKTSTVLRLSTRESWRPIQ